MAKYYYNGVLLPEIPVEVLASFPYAWISSTRKGLVVAGYPWYYSSGTMNISTSAENRKYVLSSDGSTWVLDSTYTDTGGYSVESTPLWSSHDIPNGSANASEMYFFGTEIISENAPDQRMEYLQATGKQYFNTGIVPDATTEIEIKYSVQNILSYGSHMLSCAGWYTPFPRNYSGLSFFANRLGTEVTINLTPTVNTEYTVKAFPGDKAIINGTEYDTILCGSSVPNEPLYMFTYGGSPGNTLYTATSRVYYCKIWQGGVLVRNFTPLWKAGVAGMYDEVNKVFYTSEGSTQFFAGPILGPTYDRKYLLRSNTVLYTVTNGALNALAETEITASLFQTYGVDNLPDGSLLVNLTDPEILYWQDSEDELPELMLTVTGSPSVPQTVITNTQDMSDETILGIEGVQAVCSDDILFAISFDNELTWKAYNGTQWINLDLPHTGMSRQTMENISLEAWAEIVTSNQYKIRFVIPTTDSYLTSLVVDYIN